MRGKKKEEGNFKKKTHKLISNGTLSLKSPLDQSLEGRECLWVEP